MELLEKRDEESGFGTECLCDLPNPVERSPLAAILDVVDRGSTDSDSCGEACLAHAFDFFAGTANPLADDLVEEGDFVVIHGGECRALPRRCKTLFGIVSIRNLV